LRSRLPEIQVEDYLLTFLDYNEHAGVFAWLRPSYKGVGSKRQGYDHGNFIQYGYTPGRVFLMGKGRSEHEMRPSRT
jgi:hypothetical protein